MKNKITIKIIRNLLTYFSVFLIIFIGFISCSSDDKYDIINSIPEHEHEEISKIVLKFINLTDPTLVREFSYQVKEGTTELPLTLVNIPAGTYNVETYFYSAHGDHIHDVTDEIFIEDAEDHFVYYQKLNNSQINIKYAAEDRVDAQGRKLGHKTLWNVPKEGGMVYLYLMHQSADKNPDAPSAGQLGGEIDIEAHFEIKTD